MTEAEGGASPLNMLCQQLSALTLAVTHLQQGQSQLDRRLQTWDMTLTGAGPSPRELQPEPRVPTPERFSGDLRKFRAFKNACSLYLSLLPRTFCSESIKVRFIISLLLEEPQSWAHHLLEQNSPLLTTVSSFFDAMSQLYDDPLRSVTAESTLHRLQQGDRPIEEYTAEFRKWAADTAWNDPALKHQYRLGLSETLKDELARRTTPVSLEGLIKSATQLDRRLRERQAERQPVSSASLPGNTGGESAMRRNQPRPALTPEERLRRHQNNLCLYCGEAGHFIQGCPARSFRPRTSSAAHLHVPGNHLTHLALTISLHVAGKDITLQAIIDSGACSCFIDTSLAMQLQLPLRPKAQSLRIHLADGTPPKSGPVIQETAPILTTTSTGHQEFLRFDLLASPMFPVILGMPWLQAHNPQINWSTQSLIFKSAYCLQHCLPSQTAMEGPVLCTQPESSDAEYIPAHYHDYLDVFDKQGAEQLPPHRPYDCPIELLPGSKVPFGRIFPLSEPELKALRVYIDENLKKGFIRPSASPAGAGIFFVEKKDHSLRPCIDYRELNNITIKNRYPLPLVPELFQKLRTAKFFTKLDLRGAYNLVRVREGDEWKTAFRTRFGHFEYLVMPFGLCNAPATFQHLINDVFREYLDIFIIAYLDDILIFSNTLAEHREHVIKVLTILRKHKLYAKAEKCQFETQTIQFLGLVISTEGIAMDPQKVSAILEWPTPTNKKGVQRFIGFSNFYRRFIKGFSDIIGPITQLTRQASRFCWSPEAQLAFDKLKTLFTSAPVLQHPDPDLPYVLEVDASETALGAILSQRQGPKSLLHPVAFFSRKLSPPEKNYDIGDRELLAIKAALEEWRYLLEGAAHPILVFTDHKNLEYLRTAKRLRPRQARWALFFSRFLFHITYRPGSKNGKPDALSRMFGETEENPTSDTILSPQNFLLIQPDLMSALRMAPAPGPEIESLSLQHRDGVFWHRNKIFVPQEIRSQVLKACHDSPLAGHFGTHKSTELVRRFFWWPSLAKDCLAYVNSCTTCARSKPNKTRPWGLLRPLPVPERPWDMISMDFIVELPPSEGFTTIFVVVDRLSKMAHFIPMKGTPTAIETAQTFIKEIVRLHGVPSNVVSDRGAQFTSRFWRALCKTLKIECCLSSAYHPQSNGQTERTNQTLEQYIRCFTSSSQDDWASLLPLAEFAYNNSVHTTTNQTPFWANYGYHPSFLPDSIPDTTVPTVQDKVTFLQENYQRLQEAMRKAQEAYKKVFDRRKRGELHLEPGDKVWLSTANLRLTCPSRKLGPKYIGPFPVKRKINPVAFELVLPETYKVHPVFHASLLKPVSPDPFPGRNQEPPPPVTVDGELEFEVEKILDCRRRGSRIQYLVQWKGYGPEENSWEPASNVHAPRLLRAFRNQHLGRLTRVGIQRLPLRGGHCQRNVNAGSAPPTAQVQGSAVHVPSCAPRCARQHARPRLQASTDTPTSSTRRAI